MDIKKNCKMYPKSVLTLYLKLYCSKRNTSKNKMMEGIKSWLSLSKIEKQHFMNKYKECQVQYKNKLANLLKKTQPYMKKRNKHIKRCPEGEVSKTEPQINSEEAIEQTFRPDQNNMSDQDEYDIDTSVCNIEMTNLNDELQQEPSHFERRSSTQELAEPTAPSIRTARELFEMLHTGNEQNSTWALLSSIEKNRYQRATSLLKDDYISKFKAYLESLPSKKLFEYYNNFFD